MQTCILSIAEMFMKQRKRLHVPRLFSTCTCIPVPKINVTCITDMHDIVHAFVGHSLVTKLFIGKLPATRGVWLIIG